MPFAKVGDIDVDYKRGGAGPPLLFISGSAGDLRMKPNQMDGPFPRAFDVLSYDQRGLGQTDKPDAPYSMAQYGDDAAGRARHMLPIGDTRRDAAWQAAHRELAEQLIAVAADDPYADEADRALGYRRQLEARAGHDAHDRLARIRCPTMIAAGRHDGIAPPATQEKMAEFLKG